MKNFYFFIALLVISANGFAKGEYEAMITAGPVVNGKFPHFGNQVVNNNGGTSPAKVSLRLIGRTNATYKAGSFVPVDSYYYRYEDDRGGILNNDNIHNDETLLYTESIYYRFDQSSATFNNQLKRTQDYWPNNKVKFLTYQSWKTSLGQWKDSARYGYEYDNNGKIDVMTFQQYYANMWTNDIQSDITYNGQLVTMESQLYKAAFTYDNDLRLIETVDEEKDWSGTWYKKEKHTYEYVGNNVSKHLLYEWNVSASIWVYKKSWQYTYAGNNLIAEIEQNWTGTSWVNVGKHEFAYDANNNVIEDIKSTWNSGLGAFVASNREIWQYNGQNLPELITTTTWNGTNWDPAENDKQYRLYYENYFPSSVEKLAEGDGLNLYPVPAADVLNIKLSLISAEDLQLLMYDVKGIVVHSSNHMVKDLQTSIPVSNLPTGTYVLRVAGRSTNITKPIVVQH